jgi:hypothetical protein
MQAARHAVSPRMFGHARPGYSRHGCGWIAMPSALAELLHDWHDFYVLVGTASATLVGLMFVAISIATSVFNEEQSGAMRAFITPTVTHFAAVLFTSLLITIPTHSWQTLGGLLAAEGLAGLVYGGRILFQIIVRRQFKVDLSDRLYYALLPELGYLLMVISAGLVLAQSRVSVDVIAAAQLTLLAAGIRNAWDMMVWIVIKVPGRGP